MQSRPSPQAGQHRRRAISRARRVERSAMPDGVAPATIHSMDDNTRSVLVAIAPVVAGALIAYIGFRFTKGIEERRAVREATARREAWDREDRRRWSCLLYTSPSPR